LFDHLIALFGLSLEQKLVDDRGGIGLFAQAGGARLQRLGPMRFLSGGSVQGIGARLAVG
jgi:hypothetical protein